MEHTNASIARYGAVFVWNRRSEGTLHCLSESGTGLTSLLLAFSKTNNSALLTGSRIEFRVRGKILGLGKRIPIMCTSTSPCATGVLVICGLAALLTMDEALQYFRH